MSSLNVKNINSFNQKIINAVSSGRKLYREAQTGIDKETRRPIIEKKEIILEKMPLIVVIIDEMAAIPVILDFLEDRVVGVEHTHPTPSFFTPNTRMGKGRELKKLWKAKL